MTELEIKPEDIVSKLETHETDDDKDILNWFKTLEKKKEATESLEEKENKGILAMRDRWSNWILAFIGVIVFFDILLVTFYGLGIWSFANSNVVIAVITDNFLKIVGLGLLITKEIFTKIYRR